MENFTYIARDRDGIQKQGVIDARDMNDAREIVRSRELFIVSIKRLLEADKKPKVSRRKKVKLSDLVVMSRQLATLFGAGISVVECLNAVARQSESPALSQALNEVRQSVLEGNTLADSMRLHPLIFSETFSSLVRAGEAGGQLEETLTLAADQFDREAELREKIKAAMVYPVIVFVAAVGVVAFMLIFIVPVFDNVYRQFGARLPAATEMLITLSHILTRAWWAVILVIAGATFAFRRFVATKFGKHLYHRLLLKLPLIGKLNRKVAIARFTETLAGSVKAGMPILQALAVSAQTTGNVIITEVVDRAAVLVQDGSSLSAPLEESGEFPPMVTYMMAAGEVSGNLDLMLEEISRFYSRDIEYSVSRLTRAMEPIMTILIGIIVLVILLALYMPVFTLTQVLKR